MLITFSGISFYCTCKCKYRLFVFLCKCSHSNRSFSHCCLTIHPTFPRDDKVCILHILFQLCLFQHDFNSWFQNSICKCKKCESKSSCCSCSFLLCICLWEFFFRQCCIISKPLIHLADHFRCCTFLRTKYCTASLLSAKSICYITCNLKLTLF